MSENSNKIESVKGLKINDTVLGITFNVNDIEKKDALIVNKKQLKVIEFIDNTTVKFESEKANDWLIFNFNDDSLNKLYYKDGTFTGLFSNIANFHTELHNVYKNKIDVKLNQLLDKFSRRSNETEK